MKSNIRTLTKDFTVNKNSIELFIEVYVDGKKIIDKKSDSLVVGFLKLLYSQFGGRQPIGSLDLVAQSAISGNGGGVDITNIDSSGSSVIITLPNQVTEGFYQVSGVNVISGQDINGVWELSNTSGNNYGLIGSNGGGTYEFEGAFVQRAYPNNQGFIAGASSPSNPSIVVSTSTDPIEIDSWYVDKQIKMRNHVDGVYPPNSLSAGAKTISLPHIEDHTSLFTISQTFFNGTNETINVRKAGLYAQVGAFASTGPNNQAVLLAEDFITSDLAPTETLSVNYKIVNSVTPAGGILAQFTQLYHSFISGKRNDLGIVMTNGNIFNQYPSDATSSSDYPMAAVSVGSTNGIPVQSRGNVYEGWKIGPVLGNADRSVKSTDHTLLDNSDQPSVIPFGEGDGELYYYGSVVDGWQEDPQAGTAQFTISRFFQNRGTTPVSIKQIGLNTGFLSWNNNQLTTRYMCISSNTLSQEEIFAPGEYGIVNVNLAIEV